MRIFEAYKNIMHAEQPSIDMKKSQANFKGQLCLLYAEGQFWGYNLYFWPLFHKT